jgi:protoporphyrinogen oxidase
MVAKRKKIKGKVAVVGSGITGLSTAWLLKEKGFEPILFEKNKFTGGLAGSTKVNGMPIEMFYHHFFSSDNDLIALAVKLGVNDKINFYPSTVGIYTQGRLFPFTTPVDLLRFIPINLWNRVVMGLVTLYFIKQKSWQRFEQYTCKQFFYRLKCKQLYDQVWKPLLVLKFGKYADEVPASFLWGRIHPRAQSRKGGMEMLGYFDNGFATFFAALEKKITDLKIKIINKEVTSINQRSGYVSLKSGKRVYRFDKLVFTGSNGLFLKLVGNLDKVLVKILKRIKYQAINCMILNVKGQVSPFYWLNVVDDGISFAGCIEHTNLVPVNVYGAHLIYLFNYLPVEHKIYQMEENAVFKLYTDDLKKVFPDFNRDLVNDWQLARNPYATPVYDGVYSEKIPPMQITPDIYLANTSQVYPEDRNTNNGIRLARKVTGMIEGGLW